MRRETLKVKALDDIWAFCDLINFKGGSKTFSKMHFEMSETLVRPQVDMNAPDSARRRLFLVAREHRKSTLNTTLKTLWRTYRNPNIRIAIGTDTDALALSFIRELRTYYEDEELMETVWNDRPHIEGPLIPLLSQERKRQRWRQYEDDNESMSRKQIWSATALQLNRTKVFKEPTVAAVSVGKTLTGSHYDIVILDDIVNFKNSKTLNGAETINTWAEDLENVVMKNHYWDDITSGFGEMLGDEIIINGTIYYPHDYYSNFVDKDEDETKRKLKERGYTLYRKTIFVNGKDPSDGYSFPEAFNDAVWKRLCSRVRWSTLSRQYLLKISDEEESSSLDYNKIQFIDSRTLKYESNGIWSVVITNEKEELERVLVRVYLAVDPAVSKSAKADNTAIAVGGRDYKNRLYLFDLKTKKLKPSESTKLIYEVAEKWHIRIVHIDREKLGQALSDNIQQYDSDRTLVTRFVTCKGDKWERIEFNLQPYFEDGRFYTFGHVVSASCLAEEIKFFKTSTVTDDGLDAIEMMQQVAVKTSQFDGVDRKKAQTHITVNTRYGGCR